MIAENRWDVIVIRKDESLLFVLHKGGDAWKSFHSVYGVSSPSNSKGSSDCSFIITSRLSVSVPEGGGEQTVHRWGDYLW
jgi:hypothetical protein